jgi:hypothetical protein
MAPPKPAPKPFPWEKLAIALLGILTALGAWTLKTVVETNTTIAGMQTHVTDIDPRVGDIQKDLKATSDKVDGVRSNVDKLQGKLAPCPRARELVEAAIITDVPVEAAVRVLDQQLHYQGSRSRRSG